MIANIPLEHIHTDEPLPAADDPRVRELVESIAGVGLMHPVTTVKVEKGWRLVAGRHRLKAHEVLGRQTIESQVLKLDELHLELARIDENLIRRIASALERADQLARRKEIYEALHPEAKQGGAPGKKGGGKSKGATVAGFAKDTAAKTGTAERTVQQYVQVAAKLDPAAKKTIAKTAAAESITELTKLARLPAEKQRAVGARIAESGETVKQASRALKHAEQREQIKVYVPAQGRFQVVTVDFSWPYDDALDGKGMERGLPYPPMTLEEIVTFIRGPLKERCDETACMLGSWITGPISLDVSIAPVVQREIQALGFKPLHERIWEKTEADGGPFTGLGRGIRWNAEKLQLFVRGDVLLNEMGAAHGRPLQSTVFRAPVGANSEKPQKAYDDLEQLVPYTSRLELFARAPRTGWVTSGSEMPPAKKPRKQLIVVPSEAA